MLVYTVANNGEVAAPSAHRARDNMTLSKEEIQQNKAEIIKQKTEELSRF